MGFKSQMICLVEPRDPSTLLRCLNIDTGDPPRRLSALWYLHPPWGLGCAYRWYIQAIQKVICLLDYSVFLRRKELLCVGVLCDEVCKGHRRRELDVSGYIFEQFPVLYPVQGFHPRPCPRNTTIHEIHPTIQHNNLLATFHVASPFATCQ